MQGREDDEAMRARRQRGDEGQEENGATRGAKTRGVNSESSIGQKMLRHDDFQLSGYLPGKYLGNEQWHHHMVEMRTSGI